MCNRHQYTFTGNFCQKEELMAVEGHDAEWRGRESLTHIHKSTCVTPSRRACPIQQPCVSACVCTRRRADTGGRTPGGGGAVTGGSASRQVNRRTSSDWLFCVLRSTTGFPRLFPVTHHLPLFSRCLSRSYVRSESRGGSH